MVVYNAVVTSYAWMSCHLTCLFPFHWCLHDNSGNFNSIAFDTPQCHHWAIWQVRGQLVLFLPDFSLAIAGNLPSSLVLISAAFGCIKSMMWAVPERESNFVWGGFPKEEKTNEQSIPSPLNQTPKKANKKNKAPGHVKLYLGTACLWYRSDLKNQVIFLCILHACAGCLLCNQPAVSWAIHSCSGLCCQFTWSVLGAPPFLCQEWVGRYDAPSYAQLHKSLGYKSLL